MENRKTPFINPSEVSIERTPSGVVLFPEVRSHLPKSLNEAHLMVLEGIQEGYRKQRDTGFYPSDMTTEMLEEAARRDKALLSNNTLVRWKVGGEDRRLVPVSYRRASFRRIFNDISDGLYATMQAGHRMHDDFVVSEADILRYGFQTGDTDRSMFFYINQRRHPTLGIFSGFLDRYLNPYKFTLQGWDYIQDHPLSANFSAWSRDVLRKRNRVGQNSEPVYVDFIFCDSAGQAGYAADRIWQGQTLPSQNYIAELAGYVIFLKDNVSSWKTDRQVKPFLLKSAPPSIRKRVLEDEKAITRVRRVILAAHEIGHAAHIIKSGALRRLLDMYQPLRETYADAFATVAPLLYTHQRDEIISRDELDTAIHFDIARALSKIDQHREKLIKEGGNKEEINDPYPFSLAVRTNWLLERGAVSLGSNGIFKISSVGQMAKEAVEYERALQFLTDTASRDQVEDFILHHASYPIDFFAKTA